MAALLPAVRAAGDEPAFDALRPPGVVRWPDEAARRGMARAFAGAARVTVLALGDSDPESLKRALDTGTGRRRDASLRFVTARTVTREDLEGPLMVVGRHGDGGASYLRATPCREFGAPAAGEALRVISINPWDPPSPMILVTGGDLASVHALLQRRGSARGWDYEVVRGGTRVRYGRFLSAGGVWSIDAASDTDIGTRMRTLTKGALTVFYVEGEVAATEAHRAAERARGELDRCTRRLAGPAEATGRALELHLHADLETKGLRTGDPRPSHLSPAAPGEPLRVHLALPAGSSAGEWGPDERNAVARAAIHLVLGDLKPAAIAGGAAFLMSGGLLGRDLEWWESRLSGSAREAVTGEMGRDGEDGSGSYLALTALRGVLLGSLEREPGAGSLGDLLRRPDLPGMLEQARARMAASPARVIRPAAAAPAAALQKGMGLAHEGYAVVDGYGSRSAADQLRRLKELGVGWVALSPFGFMGDPHAPEIRYHDSEEQGAGSENDHAVLATMRAAKGLGLRVMIKPHIWLPRGHWSGEVAMRSEAAWRDFFTRYRGFLAHYALLAAAGDADMLAVGVEMQDATRREAEWRMLITTARGLFDGPLTYAANWGAEFESLGFWDALDYVGLDCYYPLSDKQDPTDEELARGARLAAERAAEVSRRSGRRVLLTEVGFPALAGAWMAPHDEPDGAPTDPAAQARAYRAILSAFEGKPWLAGIYWWKWPTTPPGARPEPHFSPRGRPAEAVVAEWYAREAPRLPDWSSGSP